MPQNVLKHKVGLETHGLKNLRIVDASIMPNIITGNLNASTVMIAEKVSDMLLKSDLKKTYE